MEWAQCRCCRRSAGGLTSLDEYSIDDIVGVELLLESFADGVGLIGSRVKSMDCKWTC